MKSFLEFKKLQEEIRNKRYFAVQLFLNKQIKKTKITAGEEGRSRQYKGTAMSHDKASKVKNEKLFEFKKLQEEIRNNRYFAVLLFLFLN